MQDSIILLPLTIFPARGDELVAVAPNLMASHHCFQKIGSRSQGNNGEVGALVVRELT
jgi:hypothetical protein